MLTDRQSDRQEAKQEGRQRKTNLHQSSKDEIKVSRTRALKGMKVFMEEEVGAKKNREKEERK